MAKITKQRRMTRIESAGVRKEIVAHRQHGDGLYEYRNRTKGDLKLPKQVSKGTFNPDGSVPPNGTWEGDSYFMFMVPGDASLVRTIIDPNPKKPAVEIITPETEPKVVEPDVIILTEQHKQPIAKSPKKGSKKPMTEEKLILDQPDQITEAGKVEHVVQPKEQQLHEGKPSDDQMAGHDTLITEDPLDGVQVIKD